VARPSPDRAITRETVWRRGRRPRASAILRSDDPGRRPGLSARQSPNAAAPDSGPTGQRRGITAVPKHDRCQAANETTAVLHAASLSNPHENMRRHPTRMQQAPVAEAINPGYDTAKPSSNCATKEARRKIVTAVRNRNDAVLKWVLRCWEAGRRRARCRLSLATARWNPCAARSPLFRPLESWRLLAEAEMVHHRALQKIALQQPANDWPPAKRQSGSNGPNSPGNRAA